MAISEVILLKVVKGYGQRPTACCSVDRPQNVVKTLTCYDVGIGEISARI
jgi:hypothetical protein